MKNKYNFVLKGWYGNILTFILVLIGWVMFKADSLTYMKEYLMVMFGLEGGTAFQFYSLDYYVTPLVLAVSIVGLLLSIFRCDIIRFFYENKVVKGVVSIVLLLLSMIYMSDASFNAFIYFKF